MSENSAAGTGKNIVIFSDGTGQEGGKKTQHQCIQII